MPSVRKRCRASRATAFASSRCWAVSVRLSHEGVRARRTVRTARRVRARSRRLRPRRTNRSAGRPPRWAPSRCAPAGLRARRGSRSAALIGNGRGSRRCRKEPFRARCPAARRRAASRRRRPIHEFRPRADRGRVGNVARHGSPHEKARASPRLNRSGVDSGARAKPQ